MTWSPNAFALTFVKFVDREEPDDRRRSSSARSRSNIPLHLSAMWIEGGNARERIISSSSCRANGHQRADIDELNRWRGGFSVLKGKLVGSPAPVASTARPAPMGRGPLSSGRRGVVNDIDAGLRPRRSAAIMAEVGPAIACVADITPTGMMLAFLSLLHRRFGPDRRTGEHAALFHHGGADAMYPLAARAPLPTSMSSAPLDTTPSR